MASHVKKYEIITLAVHAPFTTHRASGISGPILGGVLCGGVPFGIDMKKETQEEEEEGGRLKVWICTFFCVFYTAKVITSALATSQLET